MTESDAADAAPIDLIVDRVRTRGCETRVTRVAMTGEGAPAEGRAARAARSARSARSFVLVGGVGVAATYFEFLAPTLAERGDVYALDLPGFAGMPRPEEQPTAAFFAAQVEGVLDHYGLVDPVVIGHSMGTQVVTELLIARPGITCAVLVSPVIDDAHPDVVTQGIRFAQSAARETAHVAATALSAYILCGVVYFLTVLPHMMRYRLIDRVPLVGARVLLIRGEFDRSSTRRLHSRLVARMRDASRWEIEGAAHSVINAHAVGVAKLTLGHLDGTLRRRGRMSDDEADLPRIRDAGPALILGALGSRAAEWFSALRGDDGGVQRAKTAHARILWQAYSRR